MQLKISSGPFKTLINFLIVFGFVFTLVLIFGKDVESISIMDASHYYNASQSFDRGEGFSFLNYNGGFRGYFFPFLLYLFTSIVPIISPKIISSLLSSLVFSVVMVYFVNKLLGCSFSLVKTLLSCSVFIYFFQDLLIYPLSDIYSFAFMLISAILVFELNSKKFIMSCIFSFVSGFMFYGAYNTRSVYIFSFFILVVLFAKKIFSDKKYALFLLPFTLGLLVSAFPQMYIHFSSGLGFTPFLQTAVSGMENGLVMFQLNAGLYGQKYETFIGNSDIYYTAGVMFFDPVMQQLLEEREQIWEINNFSEYFSIILKYPVEYVILIFKHFINLINPTYTEVYISDLRVRTYPLVFNFIIYFIVTSDILLKLKGKKFNLKKILSDRLLIVYSLLLPVVFSIPGVVETRYAMQLYILVFCYFFYVTDFKLLFSDFKKNWLLYSFLFVITALFNFTIISNLLANIKYAIVWLS